MCGALFIVFGIIGAGILGLYVDKTKKFMEATKINMSFCAVACIAFSVVRTFIYYKKKRSWSLTVRQAKKKALH